MNDMCIMYTVDGRLNVNVALNRPAYMSSVQTDDFGTHGPDQGNDGDKSNCNGISFPNSIIHTTESDVNPWYAVDLGVELEVFGVKLTNRADFNGKCGLELLFRYGYADIVDLLTPSLLLSHSRLV